MRLSLSNLVLAIAALGGTVLVASTASGGAGSAVPAVGPGSVIQAVKHFLSAIDAGSTKSLAKALVDDTRGADVAIAADGRFVKAGARKMSSFFEVSATGKPLAATDEKAFLRSLADVGPSKTPARTLTSKIRLIRANCPTPQCSYAVIEFDRMYEFGPAKKVVVPMRATVLVRYVGQEEPRFRVFHWHASRAGAARVIRR